MGLQDKRSNGSILFGQNLIGRAVTVYPEADIGDHLFARDFAAFERGAAKMRQGDEVGGREKMRIDLRFAGKHIEPGTADPAFAECSDQGFLVDQCPPCWY